MTHTIIDHMAADIGCHHPNQTETDHNGDPACNGCITEWATLPDQR